MNDSDNWPKKLTRNGSTVKIYRREVGERFEYRVDWYVGGCRRQKKFIEEGKALSFAREQLDLLAAGKEEVVAMDKSDRDAFVEAERILRPLGTGIIAAVTEYATAVGILRGRGPLTGAVRDYVAATDILGGRASLVGAAKDFVARSASPLIPIDTRDAIEEMIAIHESELAKKPKRRRDVQTLRSHLRQFAKFAVKQVAAATVDDAVTWLRTTTDTDRYYNNKRTSLVRFGNYCKLKGYLPNDRPTVFDLVRRKRNVGIHEVYALPSSSLRRLLGAAMDAGNTEAALYYCMGFFTGMRTSELQRLRWEFFQRELNCIRLPKSVTKTNRGRTVPILPVLAAWVDVLQPLPQMGKRPSLIYSSNGVRM
ncbi:MAG: tyrosine-type recombinase/integrase [Chthoniobacteraceae bacterium]